MGATLRTSACARLEPEGSGMSYSATIGPIVRRVATEFELGCATRSDYPQIQGLLGAAFQEPSTAEFLALNDAPRYDACDRLVMRRSDEIAAHVHMVPRVVHFGGLNLPTMDIKHLATLPEFRGRGLATALLDASLDEMRRAGVVVATVSTKHPGFFERSNWFPFGQVSYSTVNPRLFLADAGDHPCEQSYLPYHAEKPLTIRVCRRNELDDIRGWYDAEHVRGFGAVQRLESDWHWLLSRQSFDQLFVACESTRTHSAISDGGSPASKIVGYAVVRDCRILELVVAKRDARIQRLLIRRVCGDALEQARAVVEVHAAPDDPVHRMITRAGGVHHRTDRPHGRVAMAFLSQPNTLLSFLKPLLKERVAAAMFSSPLVLGLRWPQGSAGITIGARAVTVGPYRSTPHVVSATTSGLGQMLLGHRSGAQTIAAGLAETSTPEAARLADVLFPAIPVWRPTFEDTSAR